MSTGTLHRGHIRRFENGEYVAYIDHELQSGYSVYVVIVRGKLPGGSQFSMVHDFRNTYAAARALLRKVTNL